MGGHNDDNSPTLTTGARSVQRQKHFPEGKCFFRCTDKFRRAKDAQAWIKKRTRQTLSDSGVRKVLRRLGGKLKVPRKSHAKKDPAKAAAFKVALPQKLAAIAGEAAKLGQRVRLWVLDEHRSGLLPVIRRVWGRRGVRIHVPHATRYQWGYLHEAMEVDGANKLELLFTPCIDQVTHLGQLLPTLPPLAPNEHFVADEVEPQSLL